MTVERKNIRGGLDSPLAAAGRFGFTASLLLSLLRALFWRDETARSRTSDAVSLCRRCVVALDAVSSLL
eukprot:scaffold4287_cov65-Phaeocystis_antarctica.AAC.5